MCIRDRETIILRRLIESQAAREAALNRSADDIKELQNALFDSINQIRKLREKPSGFMERGKMKLK